MTPGANIESVTLPQVGYLSSIYLLFEGTVDNNGSATLADMGPWNVFQRITVDANMASASLWNTSGFGAYVMSSQWREGFNPSGGGIGSSTPASSIFSHDSTTGNGKALRFGLKLPIAFNAGAQVMMGLVNLQAPEVRVNLNIQCGAATAISANATAYAGTVHVYYEYFDVPDPREYMQPPLMLCRVQEETQSITSVGDNVYTVPRQGDLFNLAHIVRINGARSESIDSIRLVYNKTDVPLEMDYRWQRFVEREVTAQNPQTGVFHWNFADGEALLNGGPGLTPARDAISTEELTTLESIVKVSSGAVLGSGNNTLQSIRRFVQTLQS